LFVPCAQTQAEVGDAKPIHYRVNGFGLLGVVGVECGDPISLEFPSQLLIDGESRQIRIALSRLATLTTINSFLSYLRASRNLISVKLNISVRTRLTTRMLWAVALFLPAGHISLPLSLAFTGRNCYNHPRSR
jgi:hypothetical protein